MDLDQEITGLKARVANLEAMLEGAGAPVKPQPAHHKALKHLEAGELDEAGKAVNLDRAHEGKEDDASYGRRIKAHLGLEDSSAPIEEEAGPEAGGAGAAGTGDDGKKAE